MSMVRKCDVCGQEINYGEYGVKGKAKGLIWGEYRPAQNGKRPCVTYIRDEEDIKLDDVCQDCMEKIMEYIKVLSSCHNDSDAISDICKKAEEFGNNKLEKKNGSISAEEIEDFIKKEVSKC